MMASVADITNNADESNMHDQTHITNITNTENIFKSMLMPTHNDDDEDMEKTTPRMTQDLENQGHSDLGSVENEEQGEEQDARHITSSFAAGSLKSILSDDKPREDTFGQEQFNNRLSKDSE